MDSTRAPVTLLNPYGPLLGVRLNLATPIPSPIQIALSNLPVSRPAHLGNVPTNDFRWRRRLSRSSICSRCGLCPETIIHCFRDCSIAKAIWDSLDPSFASSPDSDFSRWFKHCIVVNEKLLTT
ncbi:hypothetical protein PIB30_102604, partial [Stylosanthes scabra]|nr:hypothetical protein [Stylosanthes scabra]